MWQICNPKSDDDLKECAELGKSLSRLSQPVILTLLARAAGLMPLPVANSQSKNCALTHRPHQE